MKKAAYRILQKLAFSLNLDSLFRRLKKGYVVLAYHSVPLEASWTYDVGKDYFEKHLSHLKKNYELLSVASIVENIRDNRDCFTVKVGITFDDGYKNTYENAYPALKKTEIPATIFLCTKYISNGQNEGDVNFGIKKHFAGKQMLNWNEVIEMKENGLIDIGAHTHTHRHLTLLSTQDALREITTSKKKLENKLGTKIELFAYSGGKFNESIKKLVKSSGFKGAFTSVRKINPPNTDPYQIGRMSIALNAQELPYFISEIYDLRGTLKKVYFAKKF